MNKNDLYQPYLPLDIGTKVVLKKHISKIYTIIHRETINSEYHTIYLYNIAKGNDIIYAIEGESIKEYKNERDSN